MIFSIVYRGKMSVMLFLSHFLSSSGATRKVSLGLLRDTSLLSPILLLRLSPTSFIRLTLSRMGVDNVFIPLKHHAGGSLCISCSLRLKLLRCRPFSHIALLNSFSHMSFKHVYLIRILICHWLGLRSIGLK